MKKAESKLEHAEETTRSIPIPHFIVSLAIALAIGMIISGWLPKNQKAIQTLDTAYSSALAEAKQIAEDEAGSRIEAMQDTLSETEEEIRQDAYNDGYTEGRCDGLQEAYDEYEGLPDRAEEYEECIAYLIDLLESYESYDDEWRDLYGGPSLYDWPSVSDYATSSSYTPTPTPAPIPTTAPQAHLVWIPTRGGSKYHSNSSCSKMKDPIQVTIDEAELDGFTPCKRCYG